MKTIKFLILAGLVALLTSCYDNEETVPLDELDVTLTKYDTTFNFQSYGTFAIPDSTLLKTNYLEEEEIADFYAEGGASERILTAVRNQFKSLGYTEVGAEKDADFIAVPTVLMVRRSAAVHFPPGWWWGHPGWGGWRPGWRWPWFPRYPWHPGYIRHYSYKEGALAIEMVDGNSYRKAIEEMKDNPNAQAEGDDLPQITIRWMANIDGYLSRNAGYNESRATRGFDEAFAQSPYLKKK